MAFMALFGWVFIPLILLYFLVQAVTAPLRWAIANPGIVNAIAAGLLGLNLLFFFLLHRLRRSRKRAGQPRGIVSLLALLWEAWVVFLCAMFLVVQPLRFFPEDIGQPFSLENDCYGTWTVTACQGVTPGCTQSQEEIDAFLGAEIAYSEDRFTSTDWAYPLEDEGAYQRGVLRRESFPPLYSMSLESLGIDKGTMDHVVVTLPEETEGDHPLGRELCVLDQDTLLLYRRGVFYRAERTDAPAPSRPDRPLPDRIRDPAAPAYFAEWTVTDCLGTDPENPMDPEMIEKILDAELDYQAESISFSGERIGYFSVEDPVYTEADMTPEDVSSAWGLSPEDLGVETGTCLAVTVEAERTFSAGFEALEAFYRSLGNRFLLLDGETMLLCGQGAFFRAKIVPDSWPTIPDSAFVLPNPDGFAESLLT